MSPALRKSLYALLAVVLAAAAAYFQAGCTPAQIQRAESAADRATAQALCAKAALELHDDALVDPSLNDLPAAAALAVALRSCFAPLSDAGAQ